MKLKPIAGAILGLTITTALTTLPVKADEDRNCRVDRNGIQICRNNDDDRNERNNRNDERNNRNDERYNRNDRVEREIERLYQEVLGRRADRGGLNAYTNRVVRDGWDYSRVRRELAQSSEARDKIRQIYRETLRENPDENIVRRYQIALERGWSLDRVREEFQNEANNRRGRWDRDRDRDDRNDRVERQVDRLYREVLGRRADRNGLRTYSDRIMRSNWDYSRVRRDLAQSREARDKITEIYRQRTGQNPDSSTISRYQRALENGWSLDRVREDVGNTRETEDRRRNGNFRYY